ncbi:hypothetical protein BJX63DRAFT_400679 [Aspergillus granulosus]|uniref:Uncharacterized protein n=1 Tax=Aspergillus granulosus TaxID=176169 RepID=A0ABR4H681_9EURO
MTRTIIIGPLRRLFERSTYSWLFHIWQRKQPAIPDLSLYIHHAHYSSGKRIDQLVMLTTVFLQLGGSRMSQGPTG